MTDTFKAHQQLAPLPQAVQAANRGSDYVVYGVTVALIVLPVAIVALFVPSLWQYGIVMAALLLYVMLSVRIFQINLLANSLRIQNSQFAHLQADITEAAKVLRLPPIDVYVVQDPYLNAFAIGIAKPYSIVLHSAVLERLTYDEMRAILVHEMGHIRFRHTVLGVYITPLSTLPVVGVFVSWLFGFWQRRIEYTADRMAVAYTGDPDLVIKALIKVYVGPVVGNRTDKEFMLYQDAASQVWLRRFSQTFADHPYLVNRIKAILRFADQHGYAMAPDVRAYIRTSWHQ